MLSIEVRVNGALIGMATAHNKVDSYDSPGGPSRYKCKVYHFDDLDDDSPLNKCFEVKHLRSDGWQALAAKVMRGGKK